MCSKISTGRVGKGRREQSIEEDWENSGRTAKSRESKIGSRKSSEVGEQRNEMKGAHVHT